MAHFFGPIGRDEGAEEPDEPYAKIIHEEVFNLCYYGEFDMQYVWNLPVGLRRFYLRRLAKAKEEEKEQAEQGNSGTPAGGGQSPPTPQNLSNPS